MSENSFKKGYLEKIDDYRWRIPKDYQAGMEVDGLVYASEEMIMSADMDEALKQVVNVAHLPGIVKYSIAMPDIHWGYGFPIGGVAATDPREGGVISPGGIGFDINCLSGDTPVLSAHGYTRTIAEMEEDWQSESLSCQNFDSNCKETTKIAAYLKRLPQKPVYRLTTEAGDEIVATADHPFWTPDGMVELDRLSVGNRLAHYPFQGIPYEVPEEKTLVDEADIVKVLAANGKGVAGNVKGQILNRLKERGLLPLRANSTQLPHLLKLLGYVFGDGTIHFIGGSGKGITWFYGEPEDLEAIRADVAAVGFTPSKVYVRRRHHHIVTTYGECNFERDEYSFKVIGSSFASTLIALGAPVGNKANQNYDIPSWIFQTPLWHQRLFLASFFGAEFSSPSAYNKRNYNFMQPMLSLNKRECCIESGRTFLDSISRMLNGFGVKAGRIKERQEYKNKDGSISYRLRLTTSTKPQSLINLWSRIGFEYNRKRSASANAAVQYLKLKVEALKIRSEAAEMAVAMYDAGFAPKEIYDDLAGEEVNKRFLERSLYETRATQVRVGGDFPTFKEYLADATAGLDGSGMVWERIVNIEQIPFDDYVYDFTVRHPHHNFIANGFVVSNCGVRLIRSDLTRDEAWPVMNHLVKSLYDHVPCGVGSEGKVRISHKEERELLAAGSPWIIERGYGWEEDIDHTEEGGCLESADPDAPSHRALERGSTQLGTLGSGNHFLEVQVVAEIYDEEAASAFGLFKDGITVMIHSGSRGFGYQVCSDFLALMGTAMAEYGIQVPDRQLACVPVDSPDGEKYLGAMASAANYAWANRQVMTHLTRQAFEEVFARDADELGMSLVYDVSHNIAKFEKYEVDGQERQLCIHRKGATRAFPPLRSEIPVDYQKVGQPVLIPGDMGRSSYVLVGTQLAIDETFGTSCHGAGRLLGRRQAKKVAKGRSISRELEDMGVIVKARSPKTLAEEMPEAYKNVSEVVNVVHNAGIAKRVARLKPVGVIKG